MYWFTFGVVLVLGRMFWKRHIIPCDSRIDMYCLLNVSVLDVLVDLSRIFSVTYRPIYKSWIQIREELVGGLLERGLLREDYRRLD